MVNSFIPRSKEEILKVENQKKEIELRKRTVIELAAQCLDDPKFKKYRLEFEEFKKTVMRYMSEPINPDPLQDAYYLRSCVNTINILDMLIGKIEMDVKSK